MHSIRHKGVTANPVSVPVMNGMPAARAFFQLAQPISYSRFAAAGRPFCPAGSCGWVNSMTFFGCVRVGHKAAAGFEHRRDAFVVEVVRVED